MESNRRSTSEGGAKGVAESKENRGGGIESVIATAIEDGGSRVAAIGAAEMASAMSTSGIAGTLFEAVF